MYELNEQSRARDWLIVLAKRKVQAKSILQEDPGFVSFFAAITKRPDKNN